MWESYAGKAMPQLICERGQEPWGTPPPPPPLSLSLLRHICCNSESGEERLPGRCLHGALLSTPSGKIMSGVPEAVQHGKALAAPQASLIHGHELLQGTYEMACKSLMWTFDDAACWWSCQSALQITQRTLDNTVKPAAKPVLGLTPRLYSCSVSRPRAIQCLAALNSPPWSVTCAAQVIISCQTCQATDH